MLRDLAKRLRPVLPAMRWLPDYGAADLRADLTAGLTVSVMLVPQGMAYAVIAGLPPIYGLYAALVPPVAYAVLGTSRQLSIGPTAIDMLIVAAGVGALAEAGTPRYVGLAILLAAVAGVVQIGMGLSRFGFLSALLSRPVITGFTAAAALTIASSQLGNLLGLALPNSQYAYVSVRAAVEHIEEVHLVSMALGLGSIALIVAGRRWREAFPAELLAVVAGTLIVWSLGLAAEGVAVVGRVPRGLPRFDVPILDTQAWRSLLPAAVTLALVQFMSVVSLGRVFARRHSYSIDANRELFALGAANVVGSFFRGLPVSGSFSRSAVNDRAGARTPLANVVVAVLIALTLLFLTPLLRYLPFPVLAGIIVVAAAGLIDVHEVHTLFQIRKREGFVALFTFICTLVIGIQEGLLLGMAASLVVVLQRMSRPHVAELGHVDGTRSFRDLGRFQAAHPLRGLLILRVGASFAFTNAAFLKEHLFEKSWKVGPPFRAVILDGRSINDLDTTAVEALFEVVDTLEKEGITLHVTGLSGPVRDLMRRSDLRGHIGEDRFHLNPHRAVVQILRRWDAEAGGERLKRYRASTKAQEKPVKGG